MAKPPKKDTQPTPKDAQRQREDDILKRMLDTPPTPHETKKKPQVPQVKKKI